MIYITGDTHGDFRRFSTKRFPEQTEMTRDDYVIVCGDFGGVWDHDGSDPKEEYWLNWLAGKSFTVLFVDGNHENFDRLNDFPVVDFHGGRAHKIRDNIYHLMRGFVFDLEGKKFFAFGGAKSHDIRDGILRLEDYSSVLEMAREYNRRSRRGEQLRVEHYSWWREELPDAEEMARGIRSLSEVGSNVDFVISHCLPGHAAAALGYAGADAATAYFDSLISDHGLTFRKWYCGHYHLEQQILGKYVVKYDSIERIV